ncbi:PEPxxWA-CTERM sorting domain-containing protein [Sphingomonas sp. RS2018]
MKTSIKLAVALAISTVITGAANAAVFTKNYVLTTNYDFSDFRDAAPYTTVVQKFTLSFDPSLAIKPLVTNYESDTAGILSMAPTSTDARVSGNIVYLQMNAAVGRDRYTYQFTTDLMGNPIRMESSFYSLDGSWFTAHSGVIALAPAPVVTAPTTGAVPEPTTWAMMIAGFGLIGGAMRRRKATLAFA